MSGAQGAGPVLGFAKWMSRRNGRSAAKRFAATARTEAEVERIVRERLKPPGRGLDPKLQEELLAEGVSAALEWWHKNREAAGDRRS